MKTYDRAAIGAMSLSDLAKVYNEITGESVKKFSDRKAGVRRVLDALNRAEGLGRPETPGKAAAPAAGAPEAPTAPGAAAKAPAKARKAAEPREHRPLALAGGADGHAARPGSKRSQLIEALQSPKGISADEAMKRFEWTRRDVSDALRLAARKNGVAVREEGGRFYGSGGAPAKVATPRKPEAKAKPAK